MTKNFKRSEFACKCGCGFDGIDYAFVQALQIARDIAKIPFVITSGCRCPKHNKAVGGVADSAHVIGKAADIACKSGTQMFTVIDALMKAGFVRIGINFAKNFVHVDVDKSKPQDVIFKY